MGYVPYVRLCLSASLSCVYLDSSDLHTPGSSTPGYRNWLCISLKNHRKALLDLLLEVRTWVAACRKLLTSISSGPGVPVALTPQVLRPERLPVAQLQEEESFEVQLSSPGTLHRSGTRTPEPEALLFKD